MPSSRNRKPTPADLSAIIEGLIKADVKFILVGGLAAVIQGSPMTTLDVDIVHERSADNIARLFNFLTSIDAIFRLPDDKIIPPVEKDFSNLTHGLFTTRFGPIDVLAVIEEGKAYEDLMGHTVELDFRGRKLHVLDLETLTSLKRNSQNPKHRQQLPVLEETLRQLKKE
jgi:hypothetical protein